MMTIRSGRLGAATTALMGGCLLAAVPAQAENTVLHEALGAPEALKLQFSLRSRSEAIDGQFRPNAAESDFLWAIQTRLFAEYDTGPVRIGAELFDARGYGQKPNSSAGTGEVNALELAQAYLGFDMGKAFGGGSTTTATVGRFTLNIGSRRLVSRQAFRNSTNAYTGAYLDWRGRADDRLILLWTMPHHRLPDDIEGIRSDDVRWDSESTDLQLYGASFTKARVFGKGTLELYAYGLNERDSAERQTRNRRLFTPGIRLFRKPAKGVFDYDVEAAYQFGEARATTAVSDRVDQNVSAWFVHAEFGKSWPGGWQPRLSAHFDAVSGDSKDSRSYKRFDTLFGARRFEYGPTSLYGAVGRANLLSPGLRLEARPAKPFDAMLMYRALWLQDASDSFSFTGVRDRTGASGRFAGHQVEARLRWTLSETVRLDMGGALLAKGRFLETAPNAPDTGDTRYAYMDFVLEL